MTTPTGSEAREPDPAATTSPPRRGWALGLVALACGVGMCLVTVIGSVTAGTAFGAAALPLAIVALLLSLGAVALGVAAIARRAGRALGIVAIVLGVLLDPALLALVLPGAPA